MGGCKHPIRRFIREDGTWKDGVNGADCLRETADVSASTKEAIRRAEC